MDESYARPVITDDLRRKPQAKALGKGSFAYFSLKKVRRHEGETKSEKKY